MGMTTEELRLIALRNAIHSGLSSASRRISLHPDALDDITALAMAGGIFGLSQDGRVQAITGQGLESWAADLIQEKPFFKENTAKPAARIKRDYGKIGDGNAARRLDQANEDSERGDRP